LGKGEAVRAGLYVALERGAGAVGFADADMSTPVEELLRIHSEIYRRTVKVVMGSRVRLLGTRVERRAVRHVLGRVFATVASNMLRLRVYDTQCGAKFFQNTPQPRQALASPFASRWAFDVELFSRLLSSPGAPYGPGDFVELPLLAWTDVKGSKLGFGSALRAGVDLFLIGHRMRRRR
jgi:hypothetical protein